MALKISSSVKSNPQTFLKKSTTLTCIKKSSSREWFFIFRMCRFYLEHFLILGLCFPLRVVIHKHLEAIPRDRVVLFQQQQPQWGDASVLWCYEVVQSFLAIKKENFFKEYFCSADGNR